MTILTIRPSVSGFHLLFPNNNVDDCVCRRVLSGHDIDVSYDL